MKTGLVIYASSVDRLSNFYSHVLGLEVAESDSTYTTLVNREFELVILETEVSKSLVRTDEPRENTPIKPTFFIDTPLDQVSKKIIDKGGFVYPPKTWAFGGRQVCDAYDCEGNIFQLRINSNV